MKRVSATAILLSLLWSPVCAAPAATAVDLSRARCEDPKVIEFIKTTLTQMKTQDGRAIASYLGNNSHLGAKTISAAKTRLDCHISVEYAGLKQGIGGRFTIELLPNGKWRSKFSPLY